MKKRIFLTFVMVFVFALMLAFAVSAGTVHNENTVDYNATVTLISKEEGGFQKAISEAKKYAIENKAFYSNQFENENNVLAHYETTALEIVDDLNGNISGFVSGIGTGGTLMGVAKRLRQIIGDDFIPQIVDKQNIDKIILVNDEDSINMSRKIALNLGIGVGISSGANMIAAILAKEENYGNIVTVFPDDNKKYISTDLSKPLDKNEKLISNQVEILGYKFIWKKFI